MDRRMMEDKADDDVLMELMDVMSKMNGQKAKGMGISEVDIKLGDGQVDGGKKPLVMGDVDGNDISFDSSDEAESMASVKDGAKMVGLDDADNEGDRDSDTLDPNDEDDDMNGSSMRGRGRIF